MTTYSSRITTGSNDAYDSNDGFPGASVTSTTLFVGATANGETLTAGFIHEDVNIPAGSTINSATLQLQRAGFDSIGNETLDGIWCLEDGTPSTFNTTTLSPHDQFVAGSPPVTTATVAWNMGADGGDNDPEVSPDFAAVVQEALDDSGGDLTDLMTLVRDTATGQNHCVCYAFENATTGRSALLNIDYTEGGAPAAAPVRRSLGLLGVGR